MVKSCGSMEKMAENQSGHGKASEHQLDRDTPPEKANTGAERQSGRPPARPPYDQYLRVSKVSK